MLFVPQVRDVPASEAPTRLERPPETLEPAAPSPAAYPPSPWELVLDRLREATEGEFDVGRELGRGGMAAVFLGRDLALNRRVAIKVMAPGLMLGEGMVERFRQEAITIANLTHAHIVSIYAVRQLDDLHFFVMQFVAGQALDTVLRTHGRLSVPVVRAILFQVGSALAYAHRRGVVHRDIKPGNILMSGDGDALVTDFGIAKVAEGPTQTQTGMVVGTPTYMSPEQCYAQPLDGRSDQYSLGVVAYELLTGGTPFSGAAFEIMRGHTTQPVPSIRAQRPDVPEAMEAAIHRMMGKTPEERFPSFGEALDALGATAVREGDPVRGELVRLAAVEERRTMLGDLLHTPSTAQSAGSGAGRRSGGAQTPAPANSGGTAAQTAVAIAPIATAIEVGDTLPLQARVLGESAGTTLQWSVDAPTVASVNPLTGALTAIAPGTGYVLATVGSVTERTTFVVVPPRVASVRLVAPSDALHTGDVVQLRAQALDKRQQPLDRSMEWQASGRAVQLAHGGSAMCTAECVAEGSAAVTVTCEGVSRTEVLQVGPARAGTLASGVAAAAGAPASNAASRKRPVWLYALVGVVVVGGGAVGALQMFGGLGGASAAEGVATVDGGSETAEDVPGDTLRFGVDQPEIVDSTPVGSNAPAERTTTPDSTSTTPDTKRPPTEARTTPPPVEVAKQPTTTAEPTPPVKRPTPPPPSTTPAISAQQQEEQALMAREARAIIESFTGAIETRQIARVRGAYPGLSAGNTETFENMFRSTTAVRVRLGEIRVVNGALYNPAIGSRTYLTADVTFDLTPVGGGTLPQAEDVLPVTLQRISSGWRLEQIGVP